MNSANNKTGKTQRHPRKSRAHVLKKADSQGFWEWDREHKELRVNLRFETAPGIDEGETREAPELWSMQLSLEDAAHTMDAADGSHKDKESFHDIELYCRTHSSEWKWILTKGRVIARDKAGHPLIISGTHTDVADRTQIEEALRRSEERFRVALTNSQVTVFEHDLELRYTFNHRPFFGYAPEYVIGKRDRDLMDPDSAAKLEAVKQSVIDTGMPTRQEVCLVAPDGRKEYFDFYAEPRRDAKGKLVGILCTAVEITARKKVEENRRRLKNIYYALSEINNAIIHESEEKILLKLVCQLAVEHGEMCFAWVGVPSANGTFTLVAQYGTSSHPSHNVIVSASADSPKGHGPAGIAYRENRPVIVNDVLNDEKLLPWRKQAIRDNVKAIAAYPIRRSDNPYAVLVILSDQVGAFAGAIASLLEGMADNVSFALGNFDRETKRKETEEALRDSESRFRNLAEAMPQLVWSATPDGKIDYFNERHQKYLGYARKESGEFEWSLALHPDDLEPVSRAWDHAIKSGEIFEIENRMRGLDNNYRWHISRGVPVFNRQGEIIRWYGTSTDIHDLKMAQETVQRRDALLRLAQQVARIGTFDWNIQANIIESTIGSEMLYGVPAGSFTGATYEQWLEFIHPEDRALAEQQIQESFLSGRLQTEWRIVRTDGMVRWFAAFGHVFKDESGRPLRMVGMNMDITERKEVEEVLARLSAQRQLALDAARLGWWSYDPIKKTVTYDQRYAEIFELQGLEPHGEDLFQHKIHPYDLPHVKAKVEASLNPSDPQTYDAQYRILLSDGSVRWVHEHGIVTFEGKGKQRRATLLVGTVADITGAKRAEEETQLAAAVYRDSSEAMMVTDENNNIIAVNQAFTDMTGYTPDDVLGLNPRIFKSGRHDAAFYEDMWQQIRATGHFRGEVWNKKKDGTFFAAQSTINSLDHESGRSRRYVSLMSDITEKKRSDELIWIQANFDTLTKLPNRRSFREALEHEVKNAKRSNLPLAVLFIDLDGFKHVNDTLGHDMGDMLLKEAAERLKKSVRESDTVARLGGDEFTLILTELHNVRNVDRVARHILHTLSEPIKLGEELAYVSASIGITLFPDDATEVEELIRNADQAMYSAKQEGKNRYHFYTSSMQEEAMRRMRIINDMRGALDADQFEIVYQPIVDLKSGIVRKAEALIRWQHPRKGLISPSEFISAAEDTGMIASFGNWMFRQAAQQSADWREHYQAEFQISVNISPVQFKKEGIDSSAWLDRLGELNLSGKGVVVEITEGLLLEASPKVTEQLLMLRDAGIEVALDDFGTGYSSLAYLKKFDIDYIKIDQTFVRNLKEGSDDMALCEAIIVMAHKLGLKVIAEGVETEEQRKLLTDAECDFAQGYLFSRPIAKEGFEQLLRAAVQFR